MIADALAHPAADAFAGIENRAFPGSDFQRFSLKRARAAGHSASDLIRKGLRVVASRYYTGRRAPSTRLFESIDMKLGDEAELFQDLER